MEKKEEKIVYLNIGGCKYVTTRQTLLNTVTTNYFTALFANNFAITRDKEGYIFIDRDGKYFEPILEYLRTGEWHCTEDLQEDKVLREAEFYQIKIANYQHTKKKIIINFKLAEDNPNSSSSRYRILTLSCEWLNETLLNHPIVTKGKDFYGATTYAIAGLEEFLAFMGERGLILISHHIVSSPATPTHQNVPPTPSFVHHFLFSFDGKPLPRSCGI